MGDQNKEKRCRGPDEDEEGRDQPLFRWTRLVLALLSPSELAAVSCTCKALRGIASSITAARASDASRSLECLPIPFINTVDRHPYAYFSYTASQTIPSPRHSRQSWPWGSSLDGHRSDPGRMVEVECGCDCKTCEVEEEAGCPCSSLDSPEMITECGPGCGCGLECGSRLTQGGISVRLKIVRDSRKGWGLHAAQLIRCRTFVCEYAGEVLTTTEARRRQKMYDELASGGRCSFALLVVREHLPSGRACMRINIDATKVGNVARFINHCCDGGNLSIEVVRSSGVLLPRLCFFATRDIQENEELTFSYGEVRLREKGMQCFCGSSSCFGVLPSEHT